MKTLEQVRAFLKKADSTSSLPSNYYRFFDMNDGEQATVRFLPDKNPDNPYGFLIEKTTHMLTINGENKSVPCLTMYGEDCPICRVASAFYKDEDKVNGKKYYKKRAHIGQVVVIEDPLPPDPLTGTTSEGQVRFINLSYQIYQAVKAEFESADLEKEPWAYEGGTDFIIKKMKQGEYSTYVNSRFARRSSDLSDDMVARVEDQLVDLSTLLPPHPSRERIEQMLAAAMTGAHYNAQQESNDSDAPPWEDKPTAATKEEKTVAAKNEPAVNAATNTSDESDDDVEAMLAQIRARRAAGN